MVSPSIGNECLWSCVAIDHYSGKVSYEEILISDVQSDYTAVKCDIKILAACVSGLRINGVRVRVLNKEEKRKESEESTSKGITYMF